VPSLSRTTSRLAWLPVDGWLGRLGLLLVVLFLLVGTFADFIMPHDPFKMMPAVRFQPPSLEHLLGTDHQGRDVFSRVIKGSQVALTVAVSTGLIATLAGLLLGSISAYGPRWLDNLLIVLFDSVRSFPAIMLALAVITLLGPSFFSVVLVISVGLIPIYARVVRTSVLSIKSAEFILAQRSIGVGPTRMMLLHIWPNILGPLFIIVSMEMPAVIAIEAGLSFLGLGVRPPTPSWGRILNEGFAFVQDTPWIVIGGGIPLVLSTLGFTFLGESLRDRLDPKLRVAKG
jgi:peptide/nickel transport system permease protein